MEPVFEISEMFGWIYFSSQVRNITKIHRFFMLFSKKLTFKQLSSMLHFQKFIAAYVIGALHVYQSSQRRFKPVRYFLLTRKERYRVMKAHSWPHPSQMHFWVISGFSRASIVFRKFKCIRKTIFNLKKIDSIVFSEFGFEHQGHPRDYEFLRLVNI